MRKLIWSIILLLVLSNMFWVYKNRELSDNNSYLENEKNELEEKVKDLESEIEDLKTDYKETLSEHEDYLNSQSDYLNSQRENISNYSENYNTDNSVSTNSNYTEPKKYIKQLNIELPSYAQTMNFDQGKVISPTIYNLHFLNSKTQSEFELIMSKNNYSLTTTRESFVSNDTKSCCYTIDKESESIAMIFTKSIDNNIESILKDNSIEYIYEDGFRKYIYMLGSQKFALYIQSNSNKFIILLKNI